MAPINTPNGNKVEEIVLPDGDTATEVIAPDGSAVFSAPPGTGMFQSPVYQYLISEYTGSDGDSPFDLPEVIAGNDATAVNSPAYVEDKSGFSASEYDGTDDAHEFTDPENALPTGAGAISVAALIYLNNQGGGVVGYGGAQNNNLDSFVLLTDPLEINVFFGNSITGSTTVPTGQWVTVGCRLDSNGNGDVFFDGNTDGSGSTTVDFTDTSGRIASTTNNSSYLDGFVADVVVSNVSEPKSAFSDYHQSRLG